MLISQEQNEINNRNSLNLKYDSGYNKVREVQYGPHTTLNFSITMVAKKVFCGLL
jgi:hypothetical protein